MFRRRRRLRSAESAGLGSHADRDLRRLPRVWRLHGSAVFPSKDQPDGSGISWIALGIGLFCLTITVALLTGKTEMSFSRRTGIMKLAGTYAWIPVRTADTSIDQVRHAEVETRRDGRSLIVVTHSGNVIRLGAFSRRGGYHEAANAINDFIAAGATR